MDCIKEYDFSSFPSNIKFKESKYFGKVPKFYEQIDPLTIRDIEFDEKLFLKFFVVHNKVNLNQLEIKFIELLNKSEKFYTDHFLIQKQNTNITHTNSLTIFFNILAVKSNWNIAKNNEKLKYLYKSFISHPGLSKFPKLHLKYLEEYCNILIQYKFDNYASLLEILFSIAGIRELTNKEEE